MSFLIGRWLPRIRRMIPLKTFGCLLGCLFGCGGLAVGLPLLAAQGDWPSWRGPTGQGSVAVGQFPERWTVESVAWKVELPGKGTSTPVVGGGRVYLTSPAEGQDAFLAFDLQGRKLWETRIGPLADPKHRSLASSCNASPVTDGQAIYAQFKSGHFAAVDLDGKILWKINLVERFGAEKIYWDSGISPVISGELVILSRIHDGESWVAGFDRKTGEVKWKTPRNFAAPAENNNGYSTPLLIEQAGKAVAIVWGSDRVTAHTVSDGQLVWSAGGFNPAGTEFWPAIASPVVHGDILIVPVGRDDRSGQANLYGVRLGGQGDVSQSHRIWERHDIGVFVAAPAVAEGRVYLLRHRGEVVCLDPATGKTLWTGVFPKTSAPYYASPVVANGILYAAREDGVVFAARVGQTFKILSENPMGERIVATPVPAADRLFLRGDKHLFCILGSAK